jgi:glycosyltransferase involved in cell wall biosynthesis
LIVVGWRSIINPYESACGQSSMTADPARHLVVAHYHFRPGGVRRVIETALPAIAAHGGFSVVTLVAGEAPEPAWLARLSDAMPGVRLVFEVHGEFLYWSELVPAPDGLPARLDRICTALVGRHGGGRTVVWAHNLALGRNAPLAAAWARAAERTGAVLLSHHHDFFFDNRWLRWPEMRASGVCDLDEAARAMFPSSGRVVHLAINRADHALLAEGFGERAVWLPNPVAPPRHGVDEDLAARAWLAARTGRDGPYWLLPCRLLRRKNIAEAVLLARWLRPGARVVTTGAPTSVDEEPYHARLRAATLREDWPLDLSVMAGAADAPPVSALLAGAEAVVFTSLQEGFGLPYLEAAAAGRPLVARALPNVLPDLMSLGLRAGVVYEDVLVPPGLFDLGRERERQRRLWEVWRATLPCGVQDLAGEPFVLTANGDAFPFSRLTLTAQEQVLSRTADDLAAALTECNPALAKWRNAGPQLPPARFDGEASAALAPARFASGFHAAVAAADAAPAPSTNTSERVMKGLVADRLRGGNLYPLVFSTET